LADASDVRKAAAAGMKRGEPAFLAPFCGCALRSLLGEARPLRCISQKTRAMFTVIIIHLGLWETITVGYTDMLAPWHNVGSGAERISKIVQLLRLQR